MTEYEPEDAALAEQARNGLHALALQADLEDTERYLAERLRRAGLPSHRHPSKHEYYSRAYGIGRAPEGYKPRDPEGLYDWFGKGGK
ncbi:hypothetical protein [Nocardia sp. NPDC020380]|uniref:hypothetical protein n=1 Tax=Nocardia sp. NPDC020380 TaxID=3364309 RepID=UPI0037B5A569